MECSNSRASALQCCAGSLEALLLESIDIDIDIDAAVQQSHRQGSPVFEMFLSCSTAIQHVLVASVAAHEKAVVLSDMY
jgi:hypothetical protein